MRVLTIRSYAGTQQPVQVPEEAAGEVVARDGQGGGPQPGDQAAHRRVEHFWWSTERSRPATAPVASLHVQVHLEPTHASSRLHPDPEVRTVAAGPGS